MSNLKFDYLEKGINDYSLKLRCDYAILFVSQALVEEVEKKGMLLFLG